MKHELAKPMKRKDPDKNGLADSQFRFQASAIAFLISDTLYFFRY
jgi:hypothetical protein